MPVPEEVQNPSVQKINFTHIALNWEEPLVPNGIITHYEINLTVIDKVENQTRTKYPGYIIELGKYILSENSITIFLLLLSSIHTIHYINSWTHY